MTIPCTTCEMKAACTRDTRCWRPQDAQHWTEEVEQAREAYQAASRRLTGALEGLAAALLREQKHV